MNIWWRLQKEDQLDLEYVIGIEPSLSRFFTYVHYLWPSWWHFLVSTMLYCNGDHRKAVTLSSSPRGFQDYGAFVEALGIAIWILCIPQKDPKVYHIPLNSPQVYIPGSSAGFIFCLLLFGLFFLPEPGKYALSLDFRLLVTLPFLTKSIIITFLTCYTCNFHLVEHWLIPLNTCLIATID